MTFGDTHLTAAATLLQCGPPLVVYVCIIAPRSLLIMATLARCTIAAVSADNEACGCRQWYAKDN